MSARRWISAALFPLMVIGALTLAGSPPVGADHCPASYGQDDDWCHTPPPTQPPPTPAPTPVPTAQPTAAPTAPPTQRPAATQRPARTQAPVSQSRTPAPTVDPDATPEPTPFDLGLEPESTPNITVRGPVFDTTPAPDVDEQPLDARQASAVSAGAWWFGIIIAFVIGFLIGRASWGLQKRRKQQLFG